MTLAPPALWLDAGPAAPGVQVPSTTAPPATGVALGSLRLTWGRRTTRDLIDPTTLSFQFLDYGTGSWVRDSFYVGRAVIIPSVFSGRITDVVARPMKGQGMVATVTALDNSADWANIYVGAGTFPQELAYDRAVRIRDAAGLTPAIVWPGPTTTEDDEFNPVVYGRDVDRRTTRELFDSIAATIDSVVTIGGGDRIIFRPNGWAPQPEPPPDVTVSADQVELRAEYTQTVADLATRVAVGWWQGTTTPGEHVQRTHYAARAAAQDQYGERVYSVQTERFGEFTTPAGVFDLGNKIINRMQVPLWRLPAIHARESLLGDDAAMETLLLAIRKYTPERGETLFLLRDTPADFPVPESNEDFPGDLYIRLLGGTYSHDGQQWHVELHGARALRSSFG